MNWATIIWSMGFGLCLALVGVHLLVWVRSRGAWANLAFAIAAASAGASSMLELYLMHARTPEEFGELLRWLHVPVAVLVVSLAWFVHLYLGAGRRWLIWLISVLRAVVLVLTFSLEPNLNFLEITGLRTIGFLGEAVVVPLGVKNPWANITHFSGVLLLLFVLDAAITGWRQGSRRQAAIVGMTFGVGIAYAILTSELMNLGKLLLPMSVSGPFLLVIVGMAYDLSVEVSRVNQLTLDLTNNRKRMDLAAEAAGLGIWDWDVARDEFWINHHVRRRLGLSASEVVTFDQFLEHIHPEDRVSVRGVVSGALKEEGPLDVECRTVSSSGVTNWVEIKGRVEREAEERELRVRGVSISVTDRKRSEQERMELRLELEHLARVLTVNELAISLAHEISQPLGAILRNAEAGELLLQQEVPDEEEVRAIFADIRRDDHRAGQVIERMRTLMKRHTPQLETLSLKELLVDTGTLTLSEVKAHRVTMDIEVPSSLPPVQGDPVQLQQVLLNLILNALDAMDDVPVESRRLLLQARRVDSDTVEVAVRDSGCGLPTDVPCDIFQTFYSTKAQGIGMGLTISRRIVELHGGQIWSENNADGGATFRFTVKTAGEGGMVSA